MLDSFRGRRIDVTEVSQGTPDFPLPELLGLLAKRGDEWLDLELEVPAPETLDLLRDDGFDMRNLP